MGAFSTLLKCLQNSVGVCVCVCPKRDNRPFHKDLGPSSTLGPKLHAGCPWKDLHVLFFPFPPSLLSAQLISSVWHGLNYISFHFLTSTSTVFFDGLTVQLCPSLKHTQPINLFIPLFCSSCSLYLIPLAFFLLSLCFSLIHTFIHILFLKG